jgi:predicted DNA-binding transcriptional regulator AlpA
MQQLLTTRQVATLLGLSEAFLERDRWSGAKIPFIKVGARAVRYDADVIREYLRQQTRKSTSDSGEGRQP